MSESNITRRLSIAVWDHDNLSVVRAGLTKAAERLNDELHISVDITFLKNQDSLREAPDSDAPGKVEGYNIAFCHVSDPNWRAISSAILPGSVRVRMSAGGELLPFLQRVNEGFLVHLLRSIRDLREDDWFEVLVAICDDEILGRMESRCEETDAALRRHFFPISSEYVVALSILCQGYLAIWGAALSNPVRPLEPGEDVLLDAIRGLDLLNLHGVSDPKTRLTEVQDGEWWDVFEPTEAGRIREDAGKRLKRRLEAELGISAGKPLPPNIDLLVKAISAGRVDVPMVVVGALKELNARRG